MKSMRQVNILSIVEEQEIETQDQLVDALRERGIEATQATVSRDIKELRLAKVMLSGGSYKYAVPEHDETEVSERFSRMLSEVILNVTSSGNLLVIRTLSGTASVAAEAIDHLRWYESLGTVAGDNTVLMVVREDTDPHAVVMKIREMMK